MVVWGAVKKIQASLANFRSAVNILKRMDMRKEFLSK